MSEKVKLIKELRLHYGIDLVEALKIVNEVDCNHYHAHRLAKQWMRRTGSIPINEERLHASNLAPQEKPPTPYSPSVSTDFSPFNLLL